MRLSYGPCIRCPLAALPLLTAPTLAAGQAKNAVTEPAVVRAVGVVMVQYTAGTAASQTVMLKLRVAKFGFCGATTEFCSGKCQSNCEQPKPSAGASNVQKRIVGYWETWNQDHPCGTMNPSEIPVSMLTHLNVAFGYISHDFQITNMDGISPTMYQNAAAVKSKNPNLKVLIALGGWTFSDPGVWQNVFPTMASTAENRATFIRNALGWLSQYGYDGIDFDWEYPGADDRGGSDGDGENYTALLKELRAAIDASGREYIVTFTAPSSYWYLRHFDITDMMAYVDWVNLMSYDLHGVWDSDNPIGNQVLAHTNLTEIDLALDLFWRNDVEPSKIVLGLGFYGRSFKLSSPACWKPGCDFTGPGDEGECTKSAGILSYREITSILEKTGAKPYFDKAAAAKYLVYGGDNWISYDDAETFKLKIDYANKLGLGGLMVLASGDSAPFTLVDLYRLFPNEDYPTDDKNPRYGMVNFGNGANLGETNPSKTGFGFFLVAGESHAVSKLKRQAGDPKPFTFLDCPANVTSQPDDQAQVARVVCLSEDVEGCFRVMERGVEGTVIEMPDNCAPGTFARAISLNASSDVFEFAFDYKFKLVRKDSDQTSIRMDYASMPGYWDELVDSEALEKIKKNFFEKSLTQALYWESVDSCNVDGSEFSEGIGAYVDGSVHARFEYGFSLYATIKNGELDVSQTNGLLFVQGYSDLTYTIGGVGKFDVAKANNGNPNWSKGQKQVIDGHTIYSSSMKGWASYKPYMAVDYMVAGEGDDSLSNSAINFNGLLSARVLTPIGPLIATFPDIDTSNPPAGQKISEPTLSIPEGNVVYSSSPGKGVSGTSVIGLGCYISFGLDLDFGIHDDDELVSFEGPNMNIRIDSMVAFENNATSGYGTCVDYNVPSTHWVWINDSGDLKAPWPKGFDGYTAFQNSKTPSGQGTCYPHATTKRSLPSVDEHQTGSEYSTSSQSDFAAKEERSDSDSLASELTKRGGSFPGFGYPIGKPVTPGLIFNSPDFNVGTEIFELHDPRAMLRLHLNGPQIWFSDKPACTTCVANTEDGAWPNIIFSIPISTREESSYNDEVLYGDEDSAQYHHLDERVDGTATNGVKQLAICKIKNIRTRQITNYPSFPAIASYGWDGIENGKWDSISRYWGNASASCSDWTVTQLQNHDTTTTPSGIVRSNYQTEHVFEAQLIADFFDKWLDTGKIYNQVPFLLAHTQKFSCERIKEYVINGLDWPGGKRNLGQPFIHYLLEELGSKSKLDRLVIYLARPNRSKGAPTAGLSYVSMGEEAQLLAIKEMGMTFEYLRDPTIWGMFCATYEGIYNKMGEFDQWYALNVGVASFNLQAEWKDYMQIVLDSMVRRLRASLGTYLSMGHKLDKKLEWH
ncbi:hypothetical protein V496_10420 [Pseudogymnoascus sp. VKM F-4515 (FW-2607)]|nr:hypothetical protein V496_10420 [Pseudogymnoascus sp. VKM F-4515 (FW-2607)]